MRNQRSQSGAVTVIMKLTNLEHNIIMQHLSAQKTTQQNKRIMDKSIQEWHI